MKNTRKNSFTPEKIEELALLLIYLQSWSEKALDVDKMKKVDVLKAWKGYDFGVLDSLKEKGHIGFSYKAKSLYITEKGEAKARKLAENISWK